MQQILMIDPVRILVVGKGMCAVRISFLTSEKARSLKLEVWSGNTTALQVGTSIVAHHVRESFKEWKLQGMGDA